MIQDSSSLLLHKQIAEVSRKSTPSTGKTHPLPIQLNQCRLTLELRNLGETPLVLTVGTRIAQLCLIDVPIHTTGKGYFMGKGKYIAPVTAELPRISDDPDWSLLESFAQSVF